MVFFHVGKFIPACPMDGMDMEVMIGLERTGHDGFSSYGICEYNP